MDNQWGLLWVEPVEGKRKGKFQKMECISSSSLLFHLLHVLLASVSTEKLERSACFTSVNQLTVGWCHFWYRLSVYLFSVIEKVCLKFNGTFFYNTVVFLCLIGYKNYFVTWCSFRNIKQWLLAGFNSGEATKPLMDRPFTLAHLYSVNYFIIPPCALPEIKTQFFKKCFQTSGILIPWFCSCIKHKV